MSSRPFAPLASAVSLASLASLAAFSALAACTEETKAPATCTASSALSLGAHDIRGIDLQDKQLSLTFDDGPGPRTAELSTYLKSEGIRAAFFVLGRNVVGNEAVLAQLVADGHVVANHTQNHFDLTTLQPAEVVKELTDVDALIAPYVQANRFMFRAPIGAWNEATYNALQPTAMDKYVGPIFWSVGGNYVPNQSAADWDCWDTGNASPQLTTAECGALYLKEIETVGKGIVLLHDPYGWANGNTVDMVKALVPQLKAKGFTFVRVDEVPQIAQLLPPLPPADAGSDAVAPTGDGGGGSSGGTSGGASGSSGGGSSGGAVDPCADGG